MIDEEEAKLIQISLQRLNVAIDDLLKLGICPSCFE